MREDELPIGQFLERIAGHPPSRVDGTAVFLTATGDGAPRALLHNVEHNHVLHRHVVLFTASTKDVPHVRAEERLAIENLGHGIDRITASYGFQDQPDIPAALALARSGGLDIDIEGTSYFLNHVTLLSTRQPGLSRWRKRLFIGMHRNATNAATFFNLPNDQVIELGTRVEI
jgi:KUP system potassium uptake protein